MNINMNMNIRNIAAKSENNSTIKMVLEIIGDAIIIGAGLSYVFIFGLIILIGGYMAVENNAFILWGEFIMGFIIIALGTERIIGDIKKYNSSIEHDTTNTTDIL